MTDNASEAEVLGNQTPAYASAAATTRLSMQAGPRPPAAAAGGASARRPPPALVAVRAAVLRSAPVASAAPVRNLPVGTSIQAKTSQAEGGWWEVDVGGATGFVRAAEVGPPGSAPVQQAAAGRNARGKAAPAAKPPPPPPAVAGPTNIRAYNQSVIAARTDGKDRLSALMTDIQSAQRRESVLYAMLANLGRS